MQKKRIAPRHHEQITQRMLLLLRLRSTTLLEDCFELWDKCKLFSSAHETGNAQLKEYVLEQTFSVVQALFVEPKLTHSISQLLTYQQRGPFEVLGKLVHNAHAAVQTVAREVHNVAMWSGYKVFFNRIFRRLPFDDKFLNEARQKIDQLDIFAFAEELLNRGDLPSDLRDRIRAEIRIESDCAAIELLKLPRRSSELINAPTEWFELCMNPEGGMYRLLTDDGVPHWITREQAGVLQALIQAEGRFVPSDELMRKVETSVLIRKHVARLPPQIRALVQPLKGHHGGFRLPPRSGNLR